MSVPAHIEAARQIQRTQLKTAAMRHKMAVEHRKAVVFHAARYLSVSEISRLTGLARATVNRILDEFPMLPPSTTPPECT